MKIIPYGKQNITESDIDAVVNVLKSDYLTQGPSIKEFETAFSEYLGCKYSVAVSNGTAALHLAAMALGVNEHTNVITTPITFAASANCIRYCGGHVYFADICPDSYTIDIAAIEQLIRSKEEGFFSGIIPVDFAGLPVNLEKLRELGRQYNLWIIEDACHSPGGYFTDSAGKKHYCGNGEFADMSVFSFHPVKHIACGEGGMITTNNEELYQKLIMLRTHGIVKEPELFKNLPDFASGKKNSQEYPEWYMEMQDLGYNYRLTDFQAALGLSQLKQADAGLERRIEIAKVYSQAFHGKDYIKSQSGFLPGHAYHLYIVEVEQRLELYRYLRTKGIYTQIHYIPCHLMPYYRDRGWKEGDMPNAEEYYKGCLSLPMYPTLSDSEQQYVINQISKFYEA